MLVFISSIMVCYNTIIKKRKENVMKGKGIKCLGLALCCAAVSLAVCGCGSSGEDGKVEIEIVQYKPEAANYFKTV